MDIRFIVLGLFLYFAVKFAVRGVISFVDWNVARQFRPIHVPFSHNESVIMIDDIKQILEDRQNMDDATLSKSVGRTRLVGS